MENAGIKLNYQVYTKFATQKAIPIMYTQLLSSSHMQIFGTSKGEEWKKLCESNLHAHRQTYCST